MTSYARSGTKYVLRFGFEHVAYRGLETGSRDYCSHVIKQNRILLVLTSPLNPKAGDTIANRIAITGDAVKDVAFRVKDCQALYEKAVSRGATSIQPPTLTKDEHGEYGDTAHSFVQRDGYKGVFLPGYVERKHVDPLSALAPLPNLAFIDHIVGNQPDQGMVPACDWYEKVLDFHRFWSVDDTQMHTEFSALRSIVMTDWDESIKMPINEPGVQHIALNTPDIIHALNALHARGLDFLSVPPTYYEDVRARLSRSKVSVKEDLNELQRLNILIDFDDKGYLLQIFTKPVEDRPTLFYEIIQRNNHTGFGAGNFKALFEAIERDQAQRGNLN